MALRGQSPDPLPAPASEPVTTSPPAPGPIPGGMRYLKLGLLVHDPGGLWSRSRAEIGGDANAEIVFPGPARTLWKGTIQPNAGISINSNGDTSKAYAGILWEISADNGLFANSGIGLAAHNGFLRTTDPRRKQLGSRLLFRIPIEAGFMTRRHHRFSIMFDHVSNGYTFLPNEGLDTIGIRYGVPF